ncbi:helix-turn-helix transcriptional regulator [Pseudoalteromonas sp. SG41-1]|nr:helix-turn-helix transcriptional regulator [Pseudoalteromonas sp. SG41-1]
MNSLSIRYYTRKIHSHQHHYHQLVLPLCGYIELEMNNFAAPVGVGQCVVIPKNTLHAFKSDENARFIVADLLELPNNLTTMNAPCFSIDDKLMSYLSFTQKQLQGVTNIDEAALCFNLFLVLLRQQTTNATIDPRINNVLLLIKKDLSIDYTLNDMAAVAYLSVTQFKAVFKQCMHTSPVKHHTQLRMEHARSLLCYSDLPIAVIGEQVGYNDPSAFSRAFTCYFKQSPTRLKKAALTSTISPFKHSVR